MSSQVVRNTETKQFERTVDGHLAFTVYREQPGEIEFVRTFVPEELRGQGIAGELIQAGLAYAEANNLKIRPTCKAFEAYVRKHPETHDRLAPGVKESLGL